MPTASGVKKRYQQHLCKGEATYITSRRRHPISGRSCFCDTM